MVADIILHPENIENDLEAAACVEPQWSALVINYSIYFSNPAADNTILAFTGESAWVCEIVILTQCSQYSV